MALWVLPHMVHMMCVSRGVEPTEKGMESTNATVGARLAFVLAKQPDVSSNGWPMTVGESIIASPPTATTLAFWTLEALNPPLCAAASLSPRARFPACSTPEFVSR